MPVTQKVTLHGVIHRLPVRGDRREPPWTQEMKQQGGDDQDDQHQCERHVFPFLHVIVESGRLPPHCSIFLLRCESSGQSSSPAYRL